MAQRKAPDPNYQYQFINFKKVCKSKFNTWAGHLDVCAQCQAANHPKLTDRARREVAKKFGPRTPNLAFNRKHQN